MTRKEMDKMRSSVLYGDEILKVRYNGRYDNFPKGVDIEAHSRMCRRSGLPYPQPKWVACSYHIEDLDGDLYRISDERYGKLEAGFEWVRD